MEVALSERCFLLLSNSLQSDSSHLVEKLYTKHTYLDIFGVSDIQQDVLSVICFHYFPNLKIITHHKIVKICINTTTLK